MGYGQSIQFLLYINDLPEFVTSTVRLFANDCLLYKEVSYSQDHSWLQQNLDNLAKWQNWWHWQLWFNPYKCYMIRIMHSKTPVIKDYYLNNEKHQVHVQPYTKEYSLKVKMTWSGTDMWIMSVGSQQDTWNNQTQPQIEHQTQDHTLGRPFMEYGTHTANKEPSWRYGWPTVLPPVIQVHTSTITRYVSERSMRSEDKKSSYLRELVWQPSWQLDNCPDRLNCASVYTGKLWTVHC